MKSFIGFLMMCFLLACAILDFLKLVEPRAPQPTHSATSPIKVSEPTAARIRETVAQMEAAQPARQFREFEPQENILIILPGAPGGFDTAESLRRKAEENTAMKWAHNTGKAAYTQAVDAQEESESRADQLKRESNERIMEALRQSRKDRRNAS